jgi:hypothetical protein
VLSSTKGRAGARASARSSAGSGPGRGAAGRRPACEGRGETQHRRGPVSLGTIHPRGGQGGKGVRGGKSGSVEGYGGCNGGRGREATSPEAQPGRGAIMPLGTDHEAQGGGVGWHDPLLKCGSLLFFLHFYHSCFRLLFDSFWKRYCCLRNACGRRRVSGRRRGDCQRVGKKRCGPVGGVGDLE